MQQSRLKHRLEHITQTPDLEITLLSPRSTSRAIAVLKLSKKLRVFVIIACIRACRTILSTLSKFSRRFRKPENLASLK